MGDMDSLQNRLEHWMTVRGTNPKRLAKDAGLHDTYVRDLLDRTVSPRLDKVIKLCDALGVYPHDLVPELASLYPAEARSLLAELSDIRERQRVLKGNLAALKE